MKKILTIAGSDSSGGAGIQADLKTFASLGAYGMTCITALTAQNTMGVSKIENASPAMVTAQLAAVYDDVPPDAVKTGMLATAANAAAAADFLAAHRGAPLVVDPVMVATSGALLLEKEAVTVYKERLFPLASVVTPNIPEAEALTGLSIRSKDDMKAAAEAIKAWGSAAVLVKGGHLTSAAADILLDENGFHEFSEPRVETKNTHGTGCTLSSALAYFLGDGWPMDEAVHMAKLYITGALLGGIDRSVGHGHGPVDHFWAYGDGWGHIKYSPHEK